MPYYDRNLNMYRASTGGYFATKELAEQAEGAASGIPAPAAATLEKPRPPDIDASTRVSTAGAARDQDFFGEGVWNASGQKPVTPDAERDPNDMPNPRNPGGMSNNDLWRNHEFNQAQGRAIGNSNAGAGGGLGTSTAQAARQVNAPLLTTGYIPGVIQHFQSGQASFAAKRNTPETQAALDAQGLGTTLFRKSDGSVYRQGRDALGTGNNQGVYVENGRENDTNFVRGGAAAATGAVLGAEVGGVPGAIIGTGLGFLAGNNRKAGGSGGTLVPTEGTGVPVYDADNNIIGYQGGSAGVNASGPGTPGSTTPGASTATGAPYAPATAGGTDGGPVVATTAQGLAETSAETDQAKGDYSAEISENEAENSALWKNANDVLEGVGHDNTLSDEARGYQREGLQQQRMLLERMLGFDPNQYATQFSDQALARQIALARSSGGGAAAQQAGIFAAMDQAPALYAEGARQAASLENQRLAQAETAAKSFGELGTMTRGQDEARSAFESTLSLDIAKQVGNLTNGQVQMNEADSQRFAEIWMDFAKLQSVYAGMSSAEQLEWWRRETTERGQDKQFEGIIAGLKAGGKVSDKDLIGGLFQLGGGAITSYGTIEAAKAGGAAKAKAA